MAVCDGPARSKLLNIQGHSSNLGCTVCLENTLKNFKPLKLDEIQYRDDLTWRSLATKITSMGLKPDDKRISSEFQGIKGYTPLMQVPSANLPFFCVTEIMHSVFLGVVKWVIDSLVDKEDAATKTDRAAHGRLLRERGPARAAQSPTRPARPPTEARAGPCPADRRADRTARKARD